MHGETCETAMGLLRRACGRPAITSCVYCGKPFCDRHGERGPDYMDVCSRSECQGKLRDIQEHQSWRREGAGSNSVSVCAEPECGLRLQHQCYQCRLGFCDAHLKEQDFTDKNRTPPRRVRALICAHCLARSKVWG